MVNSTKNRQREQKYLRLNRISVKVTEVCIFHFSGSSRHVLPCLLSQHPAGHHASVPAFLQSILNTMVGSYFQKYIRQCPSFAQNSPLAPLFIKKNTSLSRSLLFDSPFPTPNCLFIFIYFMLPFVEPPVVMLIIRYFSSLPVYLHFGDLNTCLPSAGSS